jgi:hypothetical protein
MNDMRNTYAIVNAKPQGKILFGIPRRRWEDNIKIGTQKNIM